jgi:hypothetical protein
MDEQNPTPVPVEAEMPIEADDTDTDTDTDTAETAGDNAKARATVPISVPVEFLEILKAAAEAEQITVAALARNRLAAAFDYKMPALTRNRAKIYATPEERKAAAAKAQKERYATANALLAAIKSGELNVDLPALLAKYAKKDEAATAETTPAPVAETAAA